jgi:hypothetical protein
LRLLNPPAVILVMIPGINGTTSHWCCMHPAQNHPLQWKKLYGDYTNVPNWNQSQYNLNQHPKMHLQGKMFCYNVGKDKRSIRNTNIIIRIEELWKSNVFVQKIHNSCLTKEKKTAEITEFSEIQEITDRMFNEIRKIIHE